MINVITLWVHGQSFLMTKSGKFCRGGASRRKSRSDTDSVDAITGGLAGCYWDEAGLPPAWVIKVCCLKAACNRRGEDKRRSVRKIRDAEGEK